MNDAHASATTKAGVINLTRSMARAYGPEHPLQRRSTRFVDKMVSPCSTRIQSVRTRRSDIRCRHREDVLKRSSDLPRRRRDVLQRHRARRRRGSLTNRTEQTPPRPPRSSAARVDATNRQHRFRCARLPSRCQRIWRPQLVYAVLDADLEVYQRRLAALNVDRIEVFQSGVTFLIVVNLRFIARY